MISRIKKQIKGITLISLVVTIIILLILAGVSITMLIGNNGIIARAKGAKEQTLIAEYKERIEMIKAEIRINDNQEITLEKLKDTFDGDNQKYWVNKTEIIEDKGIEKIKLTTNDGYIFYITDEMVEYKGKGEVAETPIPPAEKITAEMVSFSPEDSNWQVDNVKEALDYLYNN